MTIYCPTDDLPLNALAGLAGDADFSTDESDGEVTAYHYVWPDLTIHINLFRGAELESQLDGFVAYAESVASSKGVSLEPAVIDRIRSTKLVLGFVVTPDYEDESRFERVQDIVGAIAYNTASIVFWEGSMLDENAAPLIA
ncbi:MAG: hypothetical protein ACYTG0_30965 [Planctomycetota bacterium]|jgi:hypothetical protein